MKRTLSVFLITALMLGLAVIVTLTLRGSAPAGTSVAQTGSAAGQAQATGEALFVPTTPEVQGTALPLSTAAAPGATPVAAAASTAAPSGPAPAQGTASVPLTEMLAYAVIDQQGQNVGSIDNLFANLNDYTIAYALLKLGAGLDTSDRLYPVPLGVLRLDPQQQVMVLDVTQDHLAQAPNITRQDLTNGAPLPLPDDVRPYWGSANTGTQPGEHPSVRGTPDINPAATAQPGTATPGSGPLVLVSQVMGFDLWNQAGDRIGEIQDMIVDPQAERVTYAVLAAGTATTPDKKLILVPTGQLEFDDTQKMFRLRTDVDLTAAPGFAQDQWPDFTAADWDQEVKAFWAGQ